MQANKLLLWVRRLGLMRGFDKLYFLLNKFRFSKKNKSFKNKHPLIKLPPDYMLYESFWLDYEIYFNDGEDTAAWIKNQLSNYVSLDYKKILDWGCGPARIVRHLPQLLPDSMIYGTDYNAKTVAWCKKNIPGVEFTVNELRPPLPYNDNFFDIVYAVSVLTHLSEQNHIKWMDELYRVIKPGGIFLLTTQGNAFMNKLTQPEKRQFSKGLLVIRSKVKEGHRSFSAFQPEGFMQLLFSNRWKILKFIEGAIQNWGPEQDTWIVQKL